MVKSVGGREMPGHGSVDEPMLLRLFCSPAERRGVRKESQVDNGDLFS
jgi:hypothetical protein